MVHDPTSQEFQRKLQDLSNQLDEVIAMQREVKGLTLEILASAKTLQTGLDDVDNRLTSFRDDLVIAIKSATRLTND